MNLVVVGVATNGGHSIIQPWQLSLLRLPGQKGGEEECQGTPVVVQGGKGFEGKEKEKDAATGNEFSGVLGGEGFVFEVGQHVRICEESAGRHLFCKEGYIAKVLEKEGLLVVHGIKDLAVMKARTDEVKLVPGLAPRRSQKGLQAWSRLDKQVCLEHTGINVEVNLEASFEPLDKELFADHIGLLFGHLSWSLSLETKDEVQYLPGDLVELWHRAQALPAKAEEEVVRLNQIQLAMRHLLQTSRLLLVAIYGEGSGKGSEHWTLLVIVKGSVEGPVEAIRYYDSLTVEDASCRELACKVLQLFEIAVPLGVRNNKALQPKGTGSCGHYVFLYGSRN